jgi:hypothetical protein
LEQLNLRRLDSVQKSVRTRYRYIGMWAQPPPDSAEFREVARLGLIEGGYEEF